MLVLERRLNDTIDRLVTECVVAYFDRATLELANQARRDPLTQLLNHQAFTDELEAELDRAGRYGHGLTLVFFDIDAFKAINDTHGHQEGDRILREVAKLLHDGRRGSDIAAPGSRPARKAAGPAGRRPEPAPAPERRPVPVPTHDEKTNTIYRDSSREAV